MGSPARSPTGRTGYLRKIWGETGSENQASLAGISYNKKNESILASGQDADHLLCIVW